MTPSRYDDLLANNRAWARERAASDPEYFERLSRGQAPPFLFIGCSDSRKPLNTITGTGPGELFVHRNVGNLLPLDDANVQAVVEYAVGSLEVEHLIVCGHTRCGGMSAALDAIDDPPAEPSAVTRWLRPVVELARAHRPELEALESHAARADHLARLNALAQLRAARRLPTVAEAERSGRLELHAWCFAVETGLIAEI